MTRAEMLQWALLIAQYDAPGDYAPGIPTPPAPGNPSTWNDMTNTWDSYSTVTWNDLT